MNTETGVTFCSKLVYRDPQNDKRRIILLGIVEKETGGCIHFRTRNRVVVISNYLILTLHPTEEVFEEIKKKKAIDTIPKR